MSQKPVDENSESKLIVENNDILAEGPESKDTNSEDLPSVEIRPPSNSIVVLEKRDNNENEMSNYGGGDDDNGIRAGLLRNQ